METRTAAAVAAPLPLPSISDSVSIASTGSRRSNHSSKFGRPPRARKKGRAKPPNRYKAKRTLEGSVEVEKTKTNKVWNPGLSTVLSSRLTDALQGLGSSIRLGNKKSLDSAQGRPSAWYVLDSSPQEKDHSEQDGSRGNWPEKNVTSSRSGLALTHNPGLLSDSNAKYNAMGEVNIKDEKMKEEDTNFADFSNFGVNSAQWRDRPASPSGSDPASSLDPPSKSSKEEIKRSNDKKPPLGPRTAQHKHAHASFSRQFEVRETSSSGHVEVVSALQNAPSPRASIGSTEGGSLGADANSGKDAKVGKSGSGSASGAGTYTSSPNGYKRHSFGSSQSLTPEDTYSVRDMTSGISGSSPMHVSAPSGLIDSPDISDANIGFGDDDLSFAAAAIREHRSADEAEILHHNVFPQSPAGNDMDYSFSSVSSAGGKSTGDVARVVHRVTEQAEEILESTAKRSELSKAQDRAQNEQGVSGRGGSGEPSLPPNKAMSGSSTLFPSKTNPPSTHDNAGNGFLFSPWGGDVKHGLANTAPNEEFPDFEDDFGCIAENEVTYSIAEEVATFASSKENASKHNENKKPSDVLGDDGTEFSEADFNADDIFAARQDDDNIKDGGDETPSGEDTQEYGGELPPNASLSEQDFQLFKKLAKLKKSEAVKDITLQPHQQGAYPMEADEGTEGARSKPRSILIRKGSTRSLMSDMNESTSWQGQTSRTPSVSSRSVSWADQIKKQASGNDVGKIPEITFINDQSHTMNLKAASALEKQETQAISTSEKVATASDVNQDGRRPLARRLSENQRQLEELRESRRKSNEHVPNESTAEAVDEKGTENVENDDLGKAKYRLGLLRYSEGDFTEAKACFLSSLNWRCAMLEKGHIDICLTREKIGDAMVKLGEIEEAHWQYLLSLQAFQGQLGRKDSHVTRIMLSLGDLYFDSGSYGRALKYYEKSLRYRVEQLDEGHRDTIRSAKECGKAHIALARCSAEKNELEMALFHCREVLWLSHQIDGNRSGVSLVGKDLGVDISDVMGAILDERIQQGSENGVSRVAFSYLKESHRLLKAKGVNCAKEDIAKVMGTIALIHHKKNELENAFKCYEEKLDFLTKYLPDEKLDLAETMYALGKISSKLSKPKGAIKHYFESLNIFKVLGDKAGDKVASVLRCISTCYLALRDLVAALQCFREYVETCECRDKVEVLSTMGIIHCKLYDLPNAIDCFIEALKLESTQGNVTEIADDDLAPMIENLQGIFLAPKKFAHRNYCYEKVRDSEDMKTILQNLGLAQLKRRATKDSQRHLRDLMTHLNNDGKMNAVDFSSVLLCMGNVLFRRCRYNESILYYEQCLFGGFSHVHSQDRLDLLTNLGTAYLKIGSVDRSFTYFKEALQELEHKHGHASGEQNEDSLTVPQLTGLLKDAVLHSKESGSQDDALILSHLLGLSLCKNFWFDEAIKTFESLIEGRKASDADNYHFEVIQLMVDISDVHLMRGNFSTARSLYHQALKNSRRAKVPDMHPVVSQLRRLHGLYYPSKKIAPEMHRLSLLFR